MESGLRYVHIAGKTGGCTHHSLYRSSRQAASIAHVHQALKSICKLAWCLAAAWQGIITAFGMMSAVCNVESLLLHEWLASLQAKRRNQFKFMKTITAFQEKVC